jgi:hypothetical protein
MLNGYASPRSQRVPGSRGAIDIERIVGCPFSLSLEDVDKILPMPESQTVLVRLPFRKLGVPIDGAITHRVEAHFHRQPDRTERGRLHEELDFGWSARSRWLPDLAGVLRIRIAGIDTRIVLHADYEPPFGKLGKLFDRAVGYRLARATATDLLDRFANVLESRWAEDRKHDFSGPAMRLP